MKNVHCLHHSLTCKECFSYNEDNQNNAILVIKTLVYNTDKELSMICILCSKIYGQFHEVEKIEYIWNNVLKCFAPPV